MTEERANARECNDASVIRGSGIGEHQALKTPSLTANAEAHGRYEVECIGADGKVKWRDIIENVVATVGKNLALDTFLAGSAYTVTGPFMGLISSVSYTAVAAGDTMSSHAGWLEAGGTNAPTYSGNRKTAVWSAAASGSKALSAALSFAITSTGTAKGAFLCYGSGALATKDNTAGTLWSAGTFSTGDKAVVNGDTLNVNYSTSL
jgi:hypothetical protein